MYIRIYTGLMVLYYHRHPQTAIFPAEFSGSKGTFPGVQISRISIPVRRGISRVRKSDQYFPYPLRDLLLINNGDQAHHRIGEYLAEYHPTSYVIQTPPAMTRGIFNQVIDNPVKHRICKYEKTVRRIMNG